MADTLDRLKTLARERVELALHRWLPEDGTPPQRLHRAMRYAALGGGKRVRPILVYGTGLALGVPLERLDGAACAVELIHAYSLVHDDLPAMDDDELRRGRPTCHVAFDEATALLAGDALQTLAFYVLAHDPELADDPRARVGMIETLALASGSRGMAGGQAIDLAAVGNRLDLAELENMHIHKTGALIRASVRMATLAATATDADIAERLDHFAKCLGLAFQIRDDILDVEADTLTLGKPQGSDAARDKPTYPALLGLAESKRLAAELGADAVASLEPLGERGAVLRELAQYIVVRGN
ncbi:MAG TPA: farnesyl diphosphate synthase [Gammaproteobacteria bacterium]